MRIRQKQCDKCPWKKDTNPHEIPAGYSVEQHRKLACTIAQPGDFRGSSALMACHESPPGKEQACTGWLVHQLGPGNNIVLRLRGLDGRFRGLEVYGEQHERFEDTLPDDDDDDDDDDD